MFWLTLCIGNVKRRGEICLLKAELERRNYTVDIVQYCSPDTLRYMFGKKPRVVLVYALYGNTELRYHVYRICGKIRKIVNLQWEQVLNSDNIEKGYSVPKDYASKAVHICWGTERQKHLQKGGVAHAIVTGALQMDFLREPLRLYYDTKESCFEKYNIPKNKIVLLYISSFSYVAIEKNSGQYKYVSKFFESKMVDEICSFQRKAKSKTLQWFEKLLQKKVNIYIIYRPHPAEKEADDLKQMESKYENFRVISEESVKQWILVVDKIYTMYSTSIAEAFFADKLCQILRPVPIPEEYDACIYKNADYITTYEEFKTSLEVQSLQHFPIKPKEFYGYYENTTAYINICDLLETMLKSDAYDMPDNVSLCTYPRIAIEIIKIIIKKVLLLFGFLSKTTRFMPYKIAEVYDSEKRFRKEVCSEEEIQMITEKIRKLL